MSETQGKTVQTFILKDGRKLGYAEYGVSNGIPIFYMHIYIGSRLSGKVVEEEAIKQGVRIISVDRPGMGLSDFKPNRTLLDFPNDLVELADYLKIDKFSVVAVSGGGPYAYACAYKIPDRIHKIGVISAMGPMWLNKKGMKLKGRIIFFFARYFYSFYKFMIWLMIAKKTKNVEEESHWKEFVKIWSNELIPQDKEILSTNKWVSKVLWEQLVEAFRQGIEGPAYDGKVLASEWGFSPQDISPDVPVYIWHAELDNIIPINVSKVLAQQIPNVKTKFYKDKAHFTTVLTIIDDLVEELITYK